ncbi:hypothetical protein BDR05DRAFT_1005884 [Suillus weaverae]|nr:hypothetical protein BDR05DRAFT_1005884 [Suillus weaverae]
MPACADSTNMNDSGDEVWAGKRLSEIINIEQATEAELSQFMLGIQHVSREPLLSGDPPEWNPYPPQLILNAHPRESWAPITNKDILNAPGGCANPQAPEFEQRADARFRRGYGYFHQYHATSAAEKKSQLVRIVAPPEITAVQFKDGCAHIPPVQGMVEMQEGIPYVALVNGNNAKARGSPSGRLSQSFKL